LPWSIVLHYPYSQVPHRYESFARSGLARGARSIIAVSKFVASEAKSILGRTCEVIPHGVDTSIFRPNRALRSAVRAELGVPDNTPLLLTVAALEERKGVQWMLRALRAVAQRFPTVVYVVVGDGPYLPVLERLAQELGIVGHVHFLSSRSDVERFYQAADLFILLSRGEASPLVVLEAPACQLPIVTSLHPPFNELISPQWGRQVNETDAGLVADTIAKLLADTRMLQHMGQAGYKHILEHHSWSAVAERYLDLIV
jgi:glycosyltransferase involved in cell wall biosynthesis